jgi:ribosomal-protein-alanine N-acetyltransferase
MQSKNFDIEILSLNHVQFRVDYYSSNKEHLEIWHPTTPNGFYTFKYQENKINEQLKLVNNGESAQFVIVDKDKTKMLGHCNYTEIKKNKCWLGFSISKASEGKSLMYEALKLTNAYVMKVLGIKEIRAGILPNNDRSIRLIKRLDFKYVGEKDELEINGETRTYETYLLSASFIGGNDK